jgi:hypothetical protein
MNTSTMNKLDRSLENFNGKGNQKVGLQTMNGILIIVAPSAIIVFAQPEVNLAYTAKGIEKLNISSVKDPETTQYMLPPIEDYERLFAYRDTSNERFLTSDTITIKDEPIVIWKPIANSWASYLKSFSRTRKFFPGGDRR